MGASHSIADRYTVERTEAAPLDEALYAAVLHSDFRDHYARGRDVWTGEEAMRQAPRLLMDALRHRTGAAGPAHVLDIGAGRGRDAGLLLAAGHRVTGIDLVVSPEWETLTRRHPGRARFLATAALDLPGTAQYDAVLDNGCFHHQHPGAYGPYLRRVRELLRPGGLLTLSVFHAADGRGGLYANEGSRLYREFTEDELTALAAGHGFALVGMRQVPRAVGDLTYLVSTFRRAGDRFRPAGSPFRPSTGDQS
ncbi:class I SAM-dependent methyltransferase [Streptomyces rectiverticillatus]|uniref:SAM-dependent methyltransferase n=1 Tax=Streptomyces rectiverticillatus TaxID=173860 RepID=UPI0015C35478|nr:class I SAM-dependent methyltransferase [Streptomyces rectiverticillatus]QLE75362.1 class I SAM-dependent methyltransferase [Streptomyces rectiverticillatus]